ncbi:MAG: hypothetical protein N4A57_17835 [Anaeromicrobium sp.]|jgi:hypothetical protein|uniref:hypothetical protein n=1 Tax=Anaeromicrobium sp. TaxID=1929132 RepID=UPI0025CF5AE0|nr:hypothetical protein [Anaeromicrobium sp.]MCT4596112.1 hypothetical protein [Anaeromicrobium sp.]
MKYKIFVVIIFMTFLSGCMDLKIEKADNVIAPNNEAIPVHGSWSIKDYRLILNDLNVEKNLNKWINSRIIFSEDKIQIGNEVWKRPSYKVKRVNTEKYFSNTYKVSPKSLGISKKEVEIIDIISNGKLFAQFIKVDDNDLVIFVEYIFFNVKKMKDEEKVEFIKAPLDKKISKTGVLIGMRSDSKEYKTLWISTKENKLNPILEMNFLFVPRKTGFWKVALTGEEDGIPNLIYAYPIKNEEDIIREEANEWDREKKIVFTASEYMGIEYRHNETNEMRFKIIPIDGLKERIGIKVSDVGGKKLKEDYFVGFKRLLNSLHKSIYDSLDKNLREDNFMLYRYKGHWAMKGRTYYNDSNRDYFDFQVERFPSKKIVNYDKFHISWLEVEKKVPEAIDGFTSPNRDVAIIISDKKIYIYEIEEIGLSKDPMAVIDKKEDEKVVMAEWAIYSYVDKWDKIIKEEIQKNMKKNNVEKE